MKYKQTTDDELVRKAVDALVEKLGIVDATRFLAMPREKRMESVKRHRMWQSNLIKDDFFDKAFKE